MPSRKDPVREISHVVVYAVFYVAPLFLGFGFLMQALAGNFAGMTLANLAAALFANWLALKIYREMGVAAVGLWWNRASADNFALGLLGGMGAACATLVPALLVGAAHFTHAQGDRPTIGAAIFLGVFLLVGSASEEILFRGFGFQTLLGAFGAAPSVAICAILFGLLHLGNPGANWLGIANTIGFGAVFGYAFLRSRDLWLPIGLHFAWNFTLPLFGEKVSGLTMNVTGYEMSWTAGALWSGGAYGPEASPLATAVLVLLFLYVRKAPARRQSSPLTDPPVENAVCEPPLPLPS
ncbi:MAG: CPBP family intramembrane glutamic endopeptidase [Bryobacteraceae bacterium]